MLAVRTPLDEQIISAASTDYQLASAVRPEEIGFGEPDLRPPIVMRSLLVYPDMIGSSYPPEVMALVKAKKFLLLSGVVKA